MSQRMLLGLLVTAAKISAPCLLVQPRLSMSAALPALPPPPSGCVFCDIVSGAGGEGHTELLHADESVVVFRDIRPAARMHVLVVPREHIEDVRALTSVHRPLAEKLLSVAKEVISKHNLSVEDTRFGYHWPPFRSVKHLHLHAIAPESEMGFIGRLVFKKNSYWFVSPEYVASRLDS